MKLSVLLPVFNGEKTIEKTLLSLISQSYNDFELVVCIDGSNDKSLQIIQQYSNQFKKFKLLENKTNLGLGLTMNKLVNYASGEYIAIAEQDDFYYQNRLELQVNFLDNNPDCGMVSGIADFFDGEKITSQFPGILVNNQQYPKGKEMFFLNYKHQIKVVNSCLMIRKSIHTENGLYFSKHYPSVSVDWSYILRFSLFSNIYGINKSLVLLDRRVDRNSITSNKSKQHKAARELIRSFYYEYPDIISKKDYKFAITTQDLLELSGYKKYSFAIKFFKAFIHNPTDKRWKDYLNKKISDYKTNSIK